MRTKLIAALLVLLGCIPASAATYYVSPSGLDSHTGLASSCADTAHAWLTIGKAVSTYAAGDTVNVCDGTYSENPSLTTAGTSIAPVVFQSVNKYGAHITPVEASGTNLINIGAAWITVQNFDITGTPLSNTAIKCNGVDHCSILGNRVHDSGVQSSVCNSGAAVQPTGNFDIVSGNYIYNVGVPRTAGFRCNQYHGIYYGFGTNATIQDNIIFEVWQGYAIQINVNGGNVTNSVVSGNTVFNSGDDPHNSGGSFIFDCHATCDNNTITNNIFANIQTSGRACIWEIQETGSTLGTHNLYSANAQYNCAGDIWVTGNTNAGFSLGPTTHPQWVNYTGDQAGNYHLTASSPEIHAGVSTGCPATDFDGLVRPQGQTCDIGALEFPLVNGPPAAPTPGMFSFLTLQLPLMAFSGLPTSALNGTAIYCYDCNATCTAGGSSGRTCFRENGKWTH